MSVDTKKKELVGRFKDASGLKRAMPSTTTTLLDGVAIPYGIYDLQSNRTVYVGTSYDTRNSLECIEKWWRLKLRSVFPADIYLSATGGRRRNPPAWKHGIQHKLCNERFGRHGRTLSTRCVQVEPNRTACSARLASDSYETILNFIRTTKTKTGLVNARLVKKQYPASKSRTLRWATQHQKILFPAEVDELPSIQEFREIISTVLRAIERLAVAAVSKDRSDGRPLRDGRRSL